MADTFINLGPGWRSDYWEDLNFYLCIMGHTNFCWNIFNLLHFYFIRAIKGSLFSKFHTQFLQYQLIQAFSSKKIFENYSKIDQVRGINCALTFQYLGLPLNHWTPTTYAQDHCFSFWYTKTIIRLVRFHENV